MAIEYGLTPSGFVVKPFNVILEEQKELYRQKFGNDIDLSPESVAGAVCYNESIKIAQIWEMLGGLYTCHDVNSASGVHLDRLGNQVNVQRQNATSTEVQCVLWGDDGTIIPQGHLAEDINNYYYKLEEEATINQNLACGYALHFDNIASGVTYTFTMNGTQITYTSSSSDTTIIINGVKQAIIDAFSDDDFVFDNSYEGNILRFVSSEQRNMWNLSILTPTTISVEEIGCSAKYIGETKGAIFVGVGTLDRIVNEINGLNSIYNYIEGSTGTDVETDDWFRLSIKTKQKQSVATEPAIENAVYNVPNVSYCRCFSNRENYIKDGIPPKAIQVIVQGGDDEEIARAIFNSQPAGIQAFGDIVIDVTDSEGYVWKIGFTRPINKYLWIKVNYGFNYDNGEYHSDDVDGDIKDKIVQWCRNYLKIGDDIICNRLYQPIYQVDGLATVELAIAVTNDFNPPEESSYTSGNISILPNSIALADITRINTFHDTSLDNNS